MCIQVPCVYLLSPSPSAVIGTDVSGVGGKVGRGDESVAGDDGVSWLLVCRAGLLALERLGKC